MAEPAIITATRLFQQQLQQRNAATVAVMAERWLELESALQEEIEALAEEVVRLKPPVPAWKIYELERYQSLLAQVRVELAAFQAWALGRVQDDSLAAAQKAQADAIAVMRLAAGTRAGQVATALNRLAVQPVQQVAAVSGSRSLVRPILARMNPLAIDALTNELINAVAVGRNPRETARRMMRQGLATGLNHALLVARDQQVRAYRETQRAAYEQSGVVSGYMRVAARNQRTCVACLALDGTIYDTSELMPVHPQDRCLPAGQRVTTARGEVPIEEVKVGDLVLTHTGRWQRVAATSKRQHTGRLIRIRTAGKELLLTPEHRVLTQRGWVEAQELTATDTLVTIESIGSDVPKRSKVQP